MEFNFNEEKDRFGPETVPIPRLIERGRKNRGRPCISCGLSIKFIIKQRSPPKQLTIQIQVYLSRCSGKLSSYFFEIFWNFDFEKQANSAVTVWISSLWWRNGEINLDRMRIRFDLGTKSYTVNLFGNIFDLNSISRYIYFFRE